MQINSDHIIQQFTQTGDIGGVYGGDSFDHSLTVEEALNMGDLDWNVGLRPIYVNRGEMIHVESDEGRVNRISQELILPEDDDPWMRVPNAYATFRDDTGSTLGVVGNRYIPVQNRVAFGWVEEFLGRGIEYVTTAGTLRGGARTFVCLDLGGFEVCPGDEVRRHLVVTNSHDGTSNVVLHLIAARLACLNMLNFSGTRGQATIKIRHSSSAPDILKEISKVMGAVKEGFMRFEDAAHNMAKTKLTAEQYNDFIRQGLGITPEQYEKYDAAQAELRRPRWVGGYYEALACGEFAPGSEYGRGTLWGAYNALTGYLDHVRPVRGGDGEIKVESKLVGFDAGKKLDAFNSALLVMA